jgi:hypothetical protein
MMRQATNKQARMIGYSSDKKIGAQQTTSGCKRRA